MGHKAAMEGVLFDPSFEKGAGFYTYDVRSGVTQGCGRLARYFGMPAEDCKRGFPLETFMAAIHPEDRSRVAASIAEAVESGQVYHERYRTLVTTAGGFPVRALGFCFPDRTGQPASFVGLVEPDTGEDRFSTEADRQLVVHALSAFRLANMRNRPLAAYLFALALEDLGVPYRPTPVN